GKMVNDETGEEKELKEPPYSVPKGHTFHYEGQELLEFSIVNIPSNPNALKRDLRNQTANALHFLKRELGQDITYGEIERMKVVDVIKMLETGEKPKEKEIEQEELHNEEEGASKEGATLKNNHIKQKHQYHDNY